MVSDAAHETVTLRLRDGSIHTTDARRGTSTRPSSSPTT